MDQGAEYDVYYVDDTQGRHKVLTFLGYHYGLLCFNNQKTKKEEYYPVSRIIRIEAKINPNISYIRIDEAEQHHH